MDGSEELYLTVALTQRDRETDQGTRRETHRETFIRKKREEGSWEADYKKRKDGDFQMANFLAPFSLRGWRIRMGNVESGRHGMNWVCSGDAGTWKLRKSQDVNSADMFKIEHNLPLQSHLVNSFPQLPSPSCLCHLKCEHFSYTAVTEVTGRVTRNKIPFESLVLLSCCRLRRVFLKYKHTHSPA